jgi:hypothetical protein
MTTASWLQSDNLSRAKAGQSIGEHSAAVREVFPCPLRNRYGTEAKNRVSLGYDGSGDLIQ